MIRRIATVGVMLALVGGTARAEANTEWTVIGDGYVPRDALPRVATTAPPRDLRTNGRWIAVEDGYITHPRMRRTVRGEGQAAATCHCHAAGQAIAQRRWVVMGDGYVPVGMTNALTSPCRSPRLALTPADTLRTNTETRGATCHDALDSPEHRGPGPVGGGCMAQRLPAPAGRYSGVDCAAESDIEGRPCGR
ncbi:MAG: hypothetical protein ACP5KN_06635 [Armatimonadota bacterium]